MYKDFLVRKRLILVILLVLLCGIILTIRLGYVMFYLTEKISPMAYDQWTRDVPIEGKRGNIYDRNGKLIVGNSLSPSVAVIKRQITDKDKVAEQLSTILKTSKEDILKHLNKFNNQSTHYFHVIFVKESRLTPKASMMNKIPTF